MRSIFIAALIGAAGTSAEATTWIQVAASSSNNPVLVDTESIKHLDGSVIVWAKFMKDGGSYSIQRSEIDCREDTSKTTATESYDSNGKALEGYVYRTPIAEPIIPDSVMQGIENYVCPRSLGIPPTRRRRQKP